MKALEKLKDYIEDENRLGDLNYAHYSNIIDYVNEAIQELEKYNEEMIELRKEKEDLLNTIIEAQEAIKNILEGNK